MRNYKAVFNLISLLQGASRILGTRKLLFFRIRSTFADLDMGILE